MCCMRGGERTEDERASLPGCAVGCVARVRGLIYIDTAVEVLLMTDDALRCGQYELDRHDLHALERLRLRLRDGGDAMRWPCALPSYALAVWWRRGRTSWRFSSRQTGVSLDIHARAHSSSAGA